MAYDERTAERVRQVLAGRQDVVERKMMGGLSFMLGGRMCCSASTKGGLLIRVGAEGYQSALGEAHVQPMKMGQRVMSGFVRIAPEGYRTAARLRRWVLRGVEAAESVPPRTVSARRK